MENEYTELEIKELTQEEIEERKMGKEELEKYEIWRTTIHKTTKSVPKNFVLEWKPPYNADEQITLFNNRNWYGQSLKATSKPHWSGSLKKPYSTYRTDLEVKYLLDKINTAKRELEKEISKEPDNEEVLKSILNNLIYENKSANFSPEYIILSEEEKEKKKNQEIKNNWANINKNFEAYNFLKNEWEKRGFSYEQTKDWINAGLETNDYEFVVWLRDEKELDAEKALNQENFEELRKEYQESKNEENLEEGLSDLEKAKKQLYNYFAGTVKKYNLNSIFDGQGKQLDEHSNRDHYHHGTANWAEEIRKIEDDGNNEENKDFGDVRNALLNHFASFFIDSVLNNMDKGDEERKEEIGNYMDEHRDPNELSVYEIYKEKIEALGLTIPTEKQKLEIYGKQSE